MAARPLVNDALWRCLCPSFNPASLRANSFLRLAARKNSRSSPRRCLSVTSQCSQNALDSTSFFSAAPTADSFQPGRSPNGTVTKQRGVRGAKRDRSSLVLLPTPELYEHLRRDAAAGRHWDVMSIIKILIKDRRERPNTRLYAAMLHSFVSPDDGTAGKIRKVLEEMAEVGVDLDAGCCHAALEALAVHPDYLLREDILAYMKERWFTLTDRGHNMVVAGLLRDRLFEQAIQKIDDMGQQGIKVADWLLDMTIWILLDFREIDEAYQLLLVRQQPGRSSISQPLWSHFLDTAAKLCHVESVTDVWSARVTPGYLKPPTGTCSLVLELAARHGNIELATDVFRLFAERDTHLTSLHYETLLQAYLNASDLHAALSIVVIMRESNTKFDDAALHPLFNYLKEKQERPLEAFHTLQQFEMEGRKVATQAVNACLRASVHQHNLEEAIEIYKALHTASKAGPNTETFNILFKGCIRARRKELAMFLAAEMVKLDVKPDILTYEQLLLVCCEAEDLDDAFAYFEEMRAEGMMPKRTTLDKLIEVGVQMGDARVRGVLEDASSAVFPAAWMKAMQRRVDEMVVVDRRAEPESPDTAPTTSSEIKAARAGSDN